MKPLTNLSRTLLLFLAFYLLIISNPLAQSNFKSGYVVTLQLDTIRGMIKEQDPYFGFDKCIFKKNGDDVEQLFNPGDIKAFRFDNDRYYVTYQINEKAVFIEEVLSGSISLYKYEEQYWIRVGNDFKLLENSIEIVESNGTRRKREKKEYVGILNYILSDCTTLSNQILNTKLLERSLTDLLISYYKCTDERYIYYKENLKWTSFSFGFLAGMTATKFKLTDNSDYYIPSANWDTYLSPTIGVFGRFGFPKVNRKLGFEVGLNYLQAENNGYASSAFYFSRDTVVKSKKNHYINKSSLLKVPLSVRYKLGNRSVGPTVSGGLNITFILSNENSTQTEEYDLGVITNYEEPIFEAKSFYPGLFLAVGLEKSIAKKLNFIFLDLRYEIGTDIVVTSSQIGGSYQNAYLLLGLGF